VIDLAKKRGYKVIERAIMPEELAKAQECFLTGTAAEVTPVSEIGPYKFTPAEICRNLMTDFDALVGRPVPSPGVKSSAA
jgi:branched-chain amino acid aminotransferase